MIGLIKIKLYDWLDFYLRSAFMIISGHRTRQIKQSGHQTTVFMFSIHI